MIAKKAHLDDLKALTGLALAIGNRNVRQQGRVADNRRKRVTVLVSRPLAEELAISSLELKATHYLVMSACPVPV